MCHAILAYSSCCMFCLRFHCPYSIVVTQSLSGFRYLGRNQWISRIIIYPFNAKLFCENAFVKKKREEKKDLAAGKGRRWPGSNYDFIFRLLSCDTILETGHFISNVYVTFKHFAVCVVWRNWKFCTAPSWMEKNFLISQSVIHCDKT